MNQEKGRHTASLGFLSVGAGFFASLRDPEWPAAVVNTPDSRPRLTAALNYDALTHAKNRWKMRKAGFYLRVESWAADFVIALNIFLDCLARRAIAFFELCESVAFLEAVRLNPRQ